MKKRKQWMGKTLMPGDTLRPGERFTCANLPHIFIGMFCGDRIVAGKVPVYLASAAWGIAMCVPEENQRAAYFLVEGRGDDITFTPRWVEKPGQPGEQVMYANTTPELMSVLLNAILLRATEGPVWPVEMPTEEGARHAAGLLEMALYRREGDGQVGELIALPLPSEVLRHALKRAEAFEAEHGSMAARALPPIEGPTPAQDGPSTN